MFNSNSQWNNLGNGYESKWWPKSNGNTGIIYRPIGQMNEYPHCTEFLRPDGAIEGTHSSFDSNTHNFRGVRNKTFFIQNDPTFGS